MGLKRYFKEKFYLKVKGNQGIVKKENEADHCNHLKSILKDPKNLPLPNLYTSVGPKFDEVTPVNALLTGALSIHTPYIQRPSAKVIVNSATSVDSPRYALFKSKTGSETDFHALSVDDIAQSPLYANIQGVRASWEHLSQNTFPRSAGAKPIKVGIPVPVNSPAPPPSFIAYAKTACLSSKAAPASPFVSTLPPRQDKSEEVTPVKSKCAPVNQLSFQSSGGKLFGCCFANESGVSTLGNLLLPESKENMFKKPKPVPPPKLPSLSTSATPTSAGFKSPSVSPSPGRNSGAFFGPYNATMYGGIKALNRDFSSEDNDNGNGNTPNAVKVDTSTVPVRVKTPTITRADCQTPTTSFSTFKPESVPGRSPIAATSVEELSQAIKPSTVAKQQKLLADAMLRQSPCVPPKVICRSPAPQKSVAASTPAIEIALPADNQSNTTAFVTAYSGVLAEMALVKAMKRSEIRKRVASNNVFYTTAGDERRISCSSDTSLEPILAGPNKVQPMSSPTTSVVSMNVQASSTPIKFSREK